MVLRFKIKESVEDMEVALAKEAGLPVSLNAKTTHVVKHIYIDGDYYLPCRGIEKTPKFYEHKVNATEELESMPNEDTI